MTENQDSYRKVMKATSIFGGVQIFNILISIIKSKFVALFLGSAGMGIVGLFNSTITLVSGFTNFGLGTSAVRDVSEANNTGNHDRIAVVVSVLRRWVWVTGLLGTIIVVLFSSILSQITFGNHNYIWSFVIISSTLLFNQLNSGELVLLQGMQKVKYLAKASLIGSLIGLITTVPLYYFFGLDGIVPSLVLSSIVSLLISLYFTNKIKINKVIIPKETYFLEGKNMLKMGFMISLNALFVTGITYILQLFINARGGVEQVGLFTAGFAIINTYVGLIFTAMATDYFPRLSAVASSNDLCKKAINQQAEISILILGPIVVTFLVFIKLIILILYSNHFVAVEQMVLWLALGVFFKAASWAIAFIFLAKGVSKLFFFNELIGNIYMLLLDITGYYFWGLTGLGVSFCIGYFIYFTQVFFLSRSKYQFSFDNLFLKIFLIQFSIAIICFINVNLIAKPYSYLTGTILILISIFHSYIELDKRLGLKAIISNFLNKDK